MKEKTYRIVFFSLYEWEQIARYLEEMASEGWLLDKAGNMIWRFKRVPPQKLHFEVVFFPDASGFDPGPTEDLQAMAEYCARDGWTLLAQWGQTQVFMNDREDPVPIETDPVIQVKILHKAMKRTMLPAYFLLLAIILLQFGMRLWDLKKYPIETLSNGFYLGNLPFWVLLLASIGYEIGFYFHWIARARRAAEDGVFLPSGRSRWIAWLLLGSSVLLLVVSSLQLASTLEALLVWSGCYILILFLVTSARDFMKRKGVSRGINRTVSIGLCILLTTGFMAAAATLLIRNGRFGRRQAPETYQYHGMTWEIWQDEIPLRVEDLAPVEGIRYSTEAEEKGTLLLAKRKYLQDAIFGEPVDSPEVEYIVVEVKAGFLYDLCREAMMKEDPLFETSCRPADAAPWGAEEAYEIYRHGEPSGWYLLCLEDRIVEVRLRHLDLTPERMALMGEKLKTA